MISRTWLSTLAILLAFTGITFAIQIFDLSHERLLSSQLTQRLWISLTGIEGFLLLFITPAIAINSSTPERRSMKSIEIRKMISWQCLLLGSTLPFYFLGACWFGGTSYSGLAIAKLHWLAWSVAFFVVGRAMCFIFSDRLDAALKAYQTCGLLALTAYLISLWTQNAMFWPWSAAKFIIAGSPGSYLIPVIELVIVLFSCLAAHGFARVRRGAQT